MQPVFYCYTQQWNTIVKKQQQEKSLWSYYTMYLYINIHLFIYLERIYIYIYVIRCLLFMLFIRTFRHSNRQFLMETHSQSHSHTHTQTHHSQSTITITMYTKKRDWCITFIIFIQEMTKSSVCCFFSLPFYVCNRTFVVVVVVVNAFASNMIHGNMQARKWCSKSLLPQIKVIICTSYRVEHFLIYGCLFVHLNELCGAHV